MASEDQRRFKYKWTLPRFLVQFFSLIAVNAIGVYDDLSIR